MALHVGDVAEPEVVDQAMRDVDAVVHFAAESHVDRSILGSAAFVRTNVVGTHTLLEAARRLERPMVVVSTDEVYGDLGPHDPAFTESHPIRPSSPTAHPRRAVTIWRWRSCAPLAPTCA